MVSQDDNIGKKIIGLQEEWCKALESFVTWMVERTQMLPKLKVGILLQLVLSVRNIGRVQHSSGKGIGHDPIILVEILAIMRQF